MDAGRPKAAEEPHLRRARDTDVGAIRELVVAAYRHYSAILGRTPIPMMADYDVAVREHDVWVLEQEASLAGVLELDRRPGHLWIENVAVAPSWQGRGLGRRLLAHADAECRRLQLPELRLLTNERYAANIELYQRYGYRETHREPHLGTDLVYFVKPLPDLVPG